MEHSFITQNNRVISLKIMSTTNHYDLLENVCDLLPECGTLDEAIEFLNSVVSYVKGKSKEYTNLRLIMKKYDINQYQLPKEIGLKTNNLNAKLTGVTRFKDTEKLRIKSYLQRITGREIENLFER